MNRLTKIMLSGAVALAALLALAGCNLSQLNQAAGLLNPLLGTWSATVRGEVVQVDTVTFNFDNTYENKWTNKAGGEVGDDKTGTFQQDGTKDSFTITYVAHTDGGATRSVPNPSTKVYFISSDRTKLMVNGWPALTRQSP